MFNRIRYTAFLTQISFFVFISLSWSYVSGNCNCHLLSCLCKNVKFIPRLPSNVTSVILEDSTCFLQKKFMANLSNLALEELHFKETRIRLIEMNIFINFPYLKKLIFENPLIDIRYLNYAFNGLYLTKISKLTIIGLDIGSFLQSFLIELNGTNIKELSLIRCKLTTFNSFQFFSSLGKLQYLNLQENFIKYANWSHSSHLKVLLLKHSEIVLPAFLASNGTPFFPNLTHLEISVSNLEKMNSTTFEGLSNLEDLYIGIENNAIISATFLFFIPKLKRLSIKGLVSIQNPFPFKLTIEYGAFKSEQLQHLELEFFKLRVPYKGSLFRHAPNLLSLQLKLTEIYLLDEELSKELMPLKKLETFILTFSKLQNVPQVLCKLPNLVRIDLGKNLITFWNDTNCPVMSRLQFFSLSENAIQVIEKNTFSTRLIENDHLFWDLSLNNFLCNCRLLWFINWSEQKHDRFKFYPKNYVCATPPELKGQLLNSSFFSNGQCSTENTSLVIILSSLIGSLTLLTIITASLMYYKRWSIRYFFYLMQSRRKQKKEQKDIHNYTFDAFVCYHNSDIEWLFNKLRPKLEVDNHFSLCIHDRDFIAGRDIVENIVESIEKSRKVLLLLSKQFASSHWCRFEMAMAHQRVIEREENLLIVVLLEDIDANSQSRRLALLLKQKTYLEWTDDKDGQALFWQRLINCLQAPNLQSL